MERNFLLTIEYDGRDFHGWQRQPAQRTAQGELESVLSRICGKTVELAGASRTDAGVHALGQRASFSGEYGIPTERIMQAANNYLCGGDRLGHVPGDMRIKAVEEKPMGFHARFDAAGKKYRYIINTADEPDIFRRDYCYQVRQHLDEEAMREAAGFVVGTHDFACFQSSGAQERETTVRTVHSLTIERRGRDIVMEISGDGFLYNMVRIIAGTLTEVGLGKRTPADLAKIINSRDRRLAGHTAPAAGLYLVEVYY